MTFQEREDKHGAHAAQTPRGRPSGSWPPGAKPYFGYPATSSAFVQCYLPENFKFNGKKSKALSFQTEGEQKTSRGTNRTKDAAVLGVQTWAWQWFNSLTSVQQNALKETEALPERPAKKARV